MKDLLGDDLMTFKEVSEVLNVDNSTIRKITKKLFPEIIKNGFTTYLNEVQVTKVKLEIGKGRNDLGNVSEVTIIKTELEKKLIIKQAMSFLTEEIETLKTINKKQEEKLLIQAPKVALADDCIRDTTEHYSITNAGKQLGLSMTKIFSLLIEKRILTSSKLPTQSGLDRKMVSLRTNNVGGKNYPQSVMTMENIYNFKKVYEKDFK